MEYNHFNQLILEHRNSMIIIGILVLILIILCAFVVEFYVRRKLDCPYFKFGKFKFSPTLLILIPLIIAVVFFTTKILQCNSDINNLSYETYVGKVEYSEASIKLIDDNISIFVGKGHEVVPQGTTYGMVIYSTKSKVVVFYESRTTN